VSSRPVGTGLRSYFPYWDGIPLSLISTGSISPPAQGGDLSERLQCQWWGLDIFTAAGLCPWGVGPSTQHKASAAEHGHVS
jgi:hypothetical protein